MNAIKSLDDLKKVREEALAKRKLSENNGSTQVIVGMGTCGIAAGARETMKSVLDYIEANNVENVVVTQTGCIGLCEQEPILQVVLSGEEKVTYGKVNSDVAQKIMKDHVVSGKVVQDHVINL
ncbi:MAG: NADP-reducing hydrogenase subunit HndB [Chloroflexota bacterium]|nr:NADP-reducing hydrogenase subunit HndB [Chloroflexota bacterium]